LTNFAKTGQVLNSEEIRQNFAFLFTQDVNIDTVRAACDASAAS